MSISHWSSATFFHVALAAIGVSMFFVRVYWSISSPPRLKMRRPLVVYEVATIGTILSGFGLAFYAGEFPFVADWVTKKLMAVVLYIVVGTLLIRKVRNSWFRIGLILFQVGVIVFVVRTALLRV